MKPWRFVLHILLAGFSRADLLASQGPDCERLPGKFACINLGKQGYLRLLQLEWFVTEPVVLWHECPCLVCLPEILVPTRSFGYPPKIFPRDPGFVVAGLREGRMNRSDLDY